MHTDTRIDIMPLCRARVSCCWPACTCFQGTFYFGMNFCLLIRPNVRNEEVLLRVKEQRNILHEIRKWKANWIGHILCRNCLLQWVTEGKIKVTGRRGRRCRKLLDDLKERRGYPHLKEEALDCTMWQDHFGRGFGPVVRQTTKWMNDPAKLAHILGTSVHDTSG